MADGITILTDVESVITELSLKHDVLLKYNASDAAGNEAIEVVILVSIVDNVKPEIEGVEIDQVFENGSEVVVTFNEGTATLNGEEYINGTVITEPGEYTLVVTDDEGNVTNTQFSIEKGFASVWYWFLGLLVFPLGYLVYVGYIRKIK